MSKFNNWDHFKGDFKNARPKENPKSKKSIGDLIDQVYTDTLVYGNSIWHFKGWYGKSPTIDISKINDPIDFSGIDFSEVSIDELVSESAYQKYILGQWESECQHEPIDVGFTSPKMVCKKCDKDL